MELDPSGSVAQQGCLGARRCFLGRKDDGDCCWVAVRWAASFMAWAILARFCSIKERFTLLLASVVSIAVMMVVAKYRYIVFGLWSTINAFSFIHSFIQPCVTTTDPKLVGECGKSHYCCDSLGVRAISDGFLVLLRRHPPNRTVWTYLASTGNILLFRQASNPTRREK